MKGQKAATIVSLLAVTVLVAGGIGLLCLPCIAADADSLAEGLVLYLSFDDVREIAGLKVILDGSGHSNDGVLVSGKLAEGKFGKAFQCQAINKADEIRVKDHDSLDLDTVTVAAWIRTDQIDGQWNRILDKGWRESYNLCIGGDYQGQSWYRNRAQLECAHTALTSKAPVVDGKWHHVVGVFDGRSSRIYIDGVLNVEAKYERAVSMKHNDVDVRIGSLAVPEPRPDDQAFFDGLIDEIRLYNRALSDREIERLYQCEPIQ